MRFLFIHQNFPGQFRHVARALAEDPANEVVAIGEARKPGDRPVLHPRIQLLEYRPRAHPEKNRQIHQYLRDFEAHVYRGQAVARALLHLRDQRHFTPDVIVAHPGWGEGLFLKDIFPKSRVIQYCEYYFHATGGDVGFDPEFPANLDDHLRVRIRNSTQLHALTACDEGLSPTRWQKSRYPADFRHRIEVIHEGVDTTVVKPDPAAFVEIAGHRISAGEEIVTYVARNLEPYRGIHTFIRALPELQAIRPGARVIVVGGDGVSYGKRLPEGQNYREHYCAGVRDQVDWNRVHFTGKLPYADYVKVLQVSAAHAYLTYPFVLSWSMLEAMSAGCLIVGSRTAPVEEVLEPERNGLLVDFHDSRQLAQTLGQALAEPARYAPLRARAREDAVSRFDLHTVCLPRLLAFLQKR